MSKQVKNVKNPGEISKRTQNEMRNKKKQIIKAIKGAIDSIEKKATSGETLRDEDLRFLRNVFKEWDALEQSLVEEEEEVDMASETLELFVENVWKLNAIGPLAAVMEKTGYFRCSNCNELHKAGEECIYNQYIKLVGTVSVKEGGNEPVTD